MCTLKSSLPPNAPPTPARWSRTLSGGRSNEAATWLVVTVKSLCGYEKIHTVAAGNGERRFRSEESLILHTHRVLALDDHITCHLWVPPPQADVSNNIAVRVNGCGSDHSLRVGQRIEHFVVHRDGSGGSQRCAEPLGGNRSHRFAGITNDIGSKDRLVADHNPEAGSSRHVLGCDHRGYTGDPEGGRGIDTSNPGVRMGAAHRHSPQHPICP